MKAIGSVLVAVITAGFLVPVLVLASGPKTFTGTVTGFSGNQIIFSTTSAAKYSADSGNAQLTRKNGIAMNLSEMIVGDKISVTGTLWGDNSISANFIIDQTLYTHISTFTGKISTINTLNNSFTMDSKTYGTQTIQTNNFTSYYKNNSAATFKDLITGMTATVKAQWDRSNANLTAMTVNGTYRLINIYFTGSLQAKNGSAFTIIGNGNVIYGVDLTNATLQSKNNKTMNLNEFNTGDTLHVWGQHLSGSVAIVGTKVKDYSVTK
jgi:hypothetical protein